jgi:hypothetical protein
MIVYHTGGCQVQKGDLSNSPTPRLVIVFEGLVASVLQGREPKLAKLAVKNDWSGIVNGCYELDERVLRKLMDLSWRQNFNLNLVTWMPEKAAETIAELMDTEQIPVRGCFSSQPGRLARQLPYNPDIIKVYHSQPELALTFGSRGEYVTNMNQLGRL